MNFSLDEKLTFVAFSAWFVWLILKSTGLQVLSVVRKFMLVVVTLCGIIPYQRLASRIISIINKSTTIDTILKRALAQYKGTDWVDGFLSAVFFFIYVSFIVYLWYRESLVGKNVPRPPIRVDANLGGLVKNPKP